MCEQNMKFEPKSDDICIRGEEPAYGGEIRMTKSEIRKNIEYQNSNYAGIRVLNLEPSDLDIVSNFGFRASDFKGVVELELSLN